MIGHTSKGVWRAQALTHAVGFLFAKLAAIKTMKKQYIIYLIVGIVALALIGGGWYAYKFRECVKGVSYVPPREQREIGGGLSGLQPIPDKGDYYRFHYKYDIDLREFKTSDDAMRACIWK